MNYWFIIQMMFVGVLICLLCYEIAMILATRRAADSSGLSLPRFWEVVIISTVLLNLFSILAVLILK